MNILFVDQFGELGGGQQCLLDLIPGVAERGWRSFAAVPPAGELPARLTRLGVTVEPIEVGAYRSGTKSGADFRRFLMAAPKLAWRLKSLIKRHAIDLVYANGPRVLPAAAVAAGRRPLVFHAHNYLPDGAGRRLVRAALRIASKPNVIAVSRFVASYPGLAAEVVPNGVADLRTSEKRPQRTGPPCIGIAGRIAPEKGQLDFVEAAQMLPRDWEFVVAGAPIHAAPAYAASVRQRASGLPIQFPGWLDNLTDLLSRFDLLIVPSAPGEGFGRVIIEAFSAGVPVVAYPSGGIPEIIEDGITGYLVESPNPESLAACIRAAIDDPGGRLAIARNARHEWECNYTLALYRERVTNIMARAAIMASTAAASSTGR